MEIQITLEKGVPSLPEKKIRRKLKAVLDDLALQDKELSILFTDDPHMAQLNQRFLGKEGPTNVLAFPMAEDATDGFYSQMLGDVAISTDTALREAKGLRESLDQTIDRLLIHGILHLTGYDHEKSESEAERMEKEERRLMAMIREV